jgi:hypothetical protein
MLPLSRICQRVMMLAIISMVAACATDATGPDAVLRALTPEQKTALRVSDVGAATQDGVVMPQFQIDRLVQLVKAEISKQSSQPIMKASTDGSSQAAKINIVLTEYDEGSAFARFMIAGLGQIKLAGDVIFVDGTTGQELGRYKVSKQFAFGGIYGATTRMEDVEEGFAKSVAEILHGTKT